MRASNVRPTRRGQNNMRTIGRAPSLIAQQRIRLGFSFRSVSIEEPTIDLEAITQARAHGCVSMEEGIRAFYKFCTWAGPSVLDDQS